MSEAQSYRLEGFESDNLLAFLALLGLLKSLEVADQQVLGSDKIRPRVCWDVAQPPLRPRLVLARAITQEHIAERAATGVELLATEHRFEGRKDLNYLRTDCRKLLKHEVAQARLGSRARIDLLAALMSDGAFKVQKKMETIHPTPLCLLFGQGHQHFLERLSSVPCEYSPPPKGRTKKAISAVECLMQALFNPWHRRDETFSFRWDPEEDVRYALMAGDPTDPAYRSGTQHGANRLAAIGLAALTLSPQRRGARVGPEIIGGDFSTRGFSFAWPIWRAPTTLATIRSLLAHRDLRKEGALAHLTVEHVLETRRISVGKFMNFSRARQSAGRFE